MHFFAVTVFDRRYGQISSFRHGDGGDIQLSSYADTQYWLTVSQMFRVTISYRHTYKLSRQLRIVETLKCILIQLILNNWFLWCWKV